MRKEIGKRPLSLGDFRFRDAGQIRESLLNRFSCPLSLQPTAFRVGAAAIITVVVAALTFDSAVEPLARARADHRREAGAARRGRMVVARRDNMPGPPDVAAAGRNQILSGRSVAVAASTLQSIVQRDADENGLTLNRLDVADLPAASSGTFPLIPCSIAAVGDIYGLTEFLFALRQGRPIVDIREMSIVSSSALGEGVLQISLNIRAPAAIRQ